MAFPALFVSHGVPGAALEDDAHTQALGAWARERPRPHADLAVPTSEHFDPLFFVRGALDARDRVENVYEGFRYGSLSLRSLALAAP
jgi:aromatic ring-opening dioxygenase catalytic subunit (LigB family)